MYVVVKDGEGREVAAFMDVASITIDTNVTTGLVIEVSDDSDSQPALTVTTAIPLKDIITANKQPAT